MPNYCTFSMKVNGKKESIEEFIEILNADYDYHNNRFTAKRHFYRVFEAECLDGISKNDTDYSAIIKGYCAWSVYCCMFDGSLTYYSSGKKEHGRMFRGTMIPKESERLHLDIEIFSEETECAFMEHYIVKNGDIETDECVDYCVYFIDEYESKEEAEQKLDIIISDDEWNNRESSEYEIQRGGMEWNFSI